VQTNYTPRADRDVAGEAEPTISLSRIFRTLREYRGIIVLSLAIVMLGYAIAAVYTHLFAPSTRITTQPFRLEFEGASRGLYPNGLKFSPADVVDARVLQRVYQRAHLEKYVGYADFAQSLFVLEQNPAYNALARSYEARLSDPKLTPIDRDRIEREYTIKRDALPKNEFTLVFQHTQKNSSIPETVIRRAMSDTLNVWADVAVNEQHVTDYRVGVISPESIGSTVLPEDDYVASLVILRNQIFDMAHNIAELRKLPGAELVRTSDHLSFDDIRRRLDETIRFRIDPLLTYVIERRLIKDPAATMQFADNQLAYDQRVLDQQTSRAEAAKQTLALYTQRQVDRETAAVAAAGTTKTTPNETLISQVGDTFLDRLIALTSQAADTTYRQGLAEAYRTAVEGTIAPAFAVSYDRSLVDQLHRGATSNVTGDATYVRASLDIIRGDARTLASRANELYKTESANLIPPTQLMTITSPATSQIDRASSFSRLALGGVLVFLVTLVLVVVAVFLHARLRDEEKAEEVIAAAENDEAAPPVATPALT